MIHDHHNYSVLIFFPLTAEKWRVSLKGEVPDYIHATSIYVRDMIIPVVLSLKCALLRTSLCHGKKYISDLKYDVICQSNLLNG